MSPLAPFPPGLRSIVDQVSLNEVTFKHIAKIDTLLAQCRIWVYVRVHVMVVVIILLLSKGAVNIYGNTGPGNLKRDHG